MNLNYLYKTLIVSLITFGTLISCQKEEIIFVQEVVAEQVVIDPGDQDEQQDEEQEQLNTDDDDTGDIRYSFYIAGHTLGKPGVDNEGLHPPFKAKFDFINNVSSIDFGVFTGDIVIESNERNWNEVDADITELDKPVFFAAGNHDITDRELFESRYGRTYSSFVHESDLFIILDPNIDNWNISGDQLTFLENTINANRDVNNIFVFFHQVLWWSPDNEYNGVMPNSLDGRAESVNFWSEVVPLFTTLNSDVFFFSGDLGAFPNGSEFMHDSFGNITLIASGMGGGIRDNIVIIAVREDGSTGLRLIALNGTDPNALGDIEDFILP